MQYQTPEYEIRKRPLMANSRKLRLILRIRLYTKAGREDELPDRGAEAGEESVEWIIPHNHTIQKLQPPHHDQKPQERINQLHPLRRLLNIGIPELSCDFLRVVR